MPTHLSDLSLRHCLLYRLGMSNIERLGKKNEAYSLVFDKTVKINVSPLS